MKTFRNLLLLPALLSAQILFAQENSHLKLSDDHPAAGEKISFVYDPTGTPLEGKTSISAIAYCLDNKDYPAEDIGLKPEGKLLTGEFMVPATAQAFLIKLSSDNKIDDNGGKGYVCLIYKNDQPVPGAYAAKAYNMSNGMAHYLSGIKSTPDDAIALFKKEFAVNPQVEKEYQSSYYFLLARSPDNKAIVDNKINGLEKSSDEKDMMLAADLLNSTDRNQSADSVNMVIKAKFPNGILKRNELASAAAKEKDLHKKDSLYEVLLLRYPDLVKNEKTLDRINAEIAYAHLQGRDMEGYKKYADKLRDRSIIAMDLNNVAWDWAESGKDIGTAEKISKESVEMLTAKLDNPPLSPYAPPSVAKMRIQSSWNASADTYAYILWKENKSAEALPYMQKVYDRTSSELNSIEHYTEILGGAGQNAKAMEIIEKAFKNGQSSQALKDELNKDYIKVKGSNAGYDQYLTSLEAAAKAKILADLAKTMINKPAPAFTLKDLDGNTVSLADLKGKVVVVDFWATWCGPCKASFPGMQMAVDKFKDNPNIKFLFVDTWEHGKDYEPGVKKFIADNKYTFYVLLDEKNDAGRQAKVVTAYEVDGIPTKFVIDKNGNIRFKYVGYSGSSEKVLEEVSNMLELTSNPEMANTPPEKITNNK